MSNLAEHIEACTIAECEICDIAMDHLDNCVNAWCERCREIRKAQGRAA